MELKKAINVTLVYIAWILAGYYIKFIGIPSLYCVSIWIVPFYNFLAIKNSLASPKSPIFTIPLWIGIVGVTTLFNFLFFYLAKFPIATVIIISSIHIIELVLCQKRTILLDNTEQEIKKYYQNHPEARSENHEIKK